MARTLVFSLCNARAIGAQEFAPTVCEPSATSHAPVRLNCQAFLKRSSPSNILRVSCAGKSRQIIKAGNWRSGGKTLQGCKPSSSFTGVLPESFRCVANRHSQRLNGNQLLPNRQTVIKAEDKSGSEGFSSARGVLEDDPENEFAVLEDQFDRFSKAMASGDDKMTEQILEEMG